MDMVKKICKILFSVKHISAILQVDQLTVNN